MRQRAKHRRSTRLQWLQYTSCPDLKLTDKSAMNDSWLMINGYWWKMFVLELWPLPLGRTLSSWWFSHCPNENSHFKSGFGSSGCVSQNCTRFAPTWAKWIQRISSADLGLERPIFMGDMVDALMYPFLWLKFTQCLCWFSHCCHPTSPLC